MLPRPSSVVTSAPSMYADLPVLRLLPDDSVRSSTGSAGLAGLLEGLRADGVGRDETVVVLFTGKRREERGSG